MSFSRTVLITGGTSGLGFQCALRIARQHPEYLVVLASRTDPHSASTSINDSLGQNNVAFLPLDLSSFARIRSFVNEWEAKNFPSIQTLLLNAGLQFPGGVRKTDDGIEATFAINHVGHALLFYLLFPHLADRARVVITASATHDPAQKTILPDAKYTTAEELAHPTAKTAKNPGLQRYTTSKLANIMWTYALHRRFACISGKNLAVIAFDPGLVPGTGLAREASAIRRWAWIHLMPRIIPLLRRLINSNVHTPQESGANLAWLAVSADVEGVSGVYYEGRKKIKSSDESYEEEKQENLWEWTVKNTATSEEEIHKFEIVN
jgi:NAD(P)-dependent dehydrogenase (short-subunit alcohol dehydrogenase family)